MIRRVALIGSERLPIPPVRGGAVQTYIQEVAVRLAGEYAVTVCSAGHPDVADVQAGTDGAGVRYCYLEGGDEWDYLERLKGWLAGETFDLIHVFNRPEFLGPLAEALPGRRWVASLHNDYLVDKLSRREGRRVVETVATLVTNGAYLRANVCRKFPEAAAKTRSICSGVDLERFRPRWTYAEAEREQLKVRWGLAGERVVLYLGRLHRTKGIHLLINAVRRLAADFPDLALGIVGSSWFGEDQANRYTRKLRRLSAPLQDRIHFTGFVPPAEVPALLACADLMCSPALWQEPFPRANIEAMAVGLPVVSSPRGGIPEAITDGVHGRLVRRYRWSRAYADALRHLLEHPAEAEQMGRAGRQRVEETFTWNRVATDFRALYATLA